jgi:DNA recombination protein RmuC
MTFEILTIILFTVLIGLVIFLIWNVRILQKIDQTTAINNAIEFQVNRLREDVDRLERGMREEIRGSRQENITSLDGIRTQLTEQLDGLRNSTYDRLNQVRNTLEERLKELQAGNESKLDLMRQTVDEKLQNTLETRLGESFKLVSERLEQVHAGLGEMRTLATGVGDLKRVLGNVKTRGVFGETQLGSILEELLTPEQYAANIVTKLGSSERVEFAVKLPGYTDNPLWLPIDAKFPREDYERLLDAQERADAEAASTAGNALEQRIRAESKKIAEKYVSPPNTTDFGILFLPTEGLYAEVLRRPGLFEAMQREHRIVLAGPTTLSALLNSLRFGFRTLAIEKRSSEVWQVLGAVRTEFNKFGGVLDKVQKQIGTVSNTLTEAGTRTRAIEKRLKSVESMSDEDGQKILGLDIAGMQDDVDLTSDE